MKVCVEVTTDPEVEYDGKAIAEWMVKIFGPIAAEGTAKPSPGSVTIEVPIGEVLPDASPSRKLDAMGLSMREAVALMGVQSGLIRTMDGPVTRAETVRWLLRQISIQIWPRPDSRTEAKG